MRNVSIRRLILIFIDLVTLCLSCFSAFFLSNSLGGIVFLTVSVTYWSVILFTLCNILTLTAFGTYRNIWRYAGVKDFLSVFGSICVGTSLSYLLLTAIHKMPSNIYMVLAFLTAICAIVGLRLIYQYIYSALNQHMSTKLKETTMIVGGGLACKNLLQEMLMADCRYNPICIIDDNKEKIGRSINGIKVYGPTDKIPALCNQFGIEVIIFAMPSCDEADRKRILQICSNTNCRIKVLPYLHETIEDQDLLGQAKDINMEDLLGRKSIKFDNCEVASFIRDEVCMVTGGGGSIGSELCRQIVKYKPKQLVIVDIYENNAYEIQQELIQLYGDSLNLSVQIASVRDFKKMDYLFKEFQPTVVFHAAAHKHVPLMETNPEEAVKNNVIGTFNIANLADLYKVKKFVLVSTDKAVNPTNVMGATKRCCEMIMQYMAEQSESTEFVAVRFGNVLGSNGSVIPLFKKQIEAGGPVTVTHPDIIRYFMTIPEAVSLILQAGAMAHGGEIFVLDMGEPVKIVTLAENLIRQYGKEPYRDVKIEFTGLRPGEKLYEELLMNEEGLQSTMNNKIFIGNQIPVDIDSFIDKMRALKEIVDDGDVTVIIRRLYDLVPTFTHKGLLPQDQDAQPDSPKPDAAEFDPAESGSADCYSEKKKA